MPGARGRRGQDVVGLEPVRHDDGDAEIAQCLRGVGELLDERFQLLGPVRLVAGPLLAAPRTVRVVEADDHDRRAHALDRGDELGQQAAHCPGGLPGARLGVIAAVDEGVAVDGEHDRFVGGNHAVHSLTADRRNVRARRRCPRTIAAAGAARTCCHAVPAHRLGTSGSPARVAAARSGLVR